MAGGVCVVTRLGRERGRPDARRGVASQLAATALSSAAHALPLRREMRFGAGAADLRHQ